jgi:hypothetical protein
MEGRVAGLVRSWNPQLILTVGDNNYPDGAAETIDANIGQYYHDYIYPYRGHYGPGSAFNRFFPTLGNHDWNTPGARPYLDYFELPGNERYYDFVWGPVHFFALDSDSREPDGFRSTSLQAEWLRAALAASTTPWQVVYMHHPPYSSGAHGGVSWMNWPYREWGASVVISGHDHIYERILLDGFPYFISGLGGYPATYGLNNDAPGSQIAYNDDHGALRVEVTEAGMLFEFYTWSGSLVDRYTHPAP